MSLPASVLRTLPASVLRTLARWAEHGARAGGGSASLHLVRLSDRLMRMSSHLAPPPHPAPQHPAPAAGPDAAPHPQPAMPAPAYQPPSSPWPPSPWPPSPWHGLRLFGLTVLWTWRVTTAPIRLTVWLAEAVVTLAMAAVLLGGAAWAMGLIPDETVLRLARPLMERLGGFVVHSIEQVLQNRGGG